MTDIADRAQELIDQQTAQALAQALANRPAGESATACIACGDPIPEERRAAVPGTPHCTDCSAEADRRRRIMAYSDI